MLKPWHQYNEQYYSNGGPGKSDHRTSHVFTGQLVPDTQVIVYTQENIGHGKQRHHIRTFCPFAAMDGEGRTISPHQYTKLMNRNKKQQTITKLHHRAWSSWAFSSLLRLKRTVLPPSKCLDGDGNKNSQPDNVGKHTQLSFYVRRGQIHHMLINETAHISFHNTALILQWWAGKEYFIIFSRVP